MKQMITLLLVLLGACLQAQDPAYPPAPAAATNITRAEYFIDTDPGFGAGTTIPVTAAADIPSLAASINTGALTAGAHKLCVRTLSAAGNWSITSVVQFVVDFDPAYPSVPASLLNIVKAEYFIDTDPGFGSGFNIPVTAATDIVSLVAGINTASLTAGVHQLYLRTLNAEGRWSFTAIRQFAVDFDPAYPPAPAAVQNIVKLEYFIDGDPGFGNAIDVPVLAATDLPSVIIPVNTNLMASGTHSITLRTRNAEGQWSVTAIRNFIIDADPAYPATPSAAGIIANAEYFFDTDPGFGSGTAFSFTPGVDVNGISLNANTASLSPGPHTLYIRTMGPASITNFVSFNVANVVPLQLLSLDAIEKSGVVTIEATTTNEQNTNRIELEKSYDGQNFTMLQLLPTHNTPGKHLYRFTDAAPQQGVNYYRLKMTDKDGRYTHSKIIVVQAGGRLPWLLYPNPAKNSIVLRGSQPVAATVEIVNVAGAVVVQKNYGAATAEKLVDIAKLPAGLYWVRIKTAATTWVTNFVKE
ncbi:MAG: T9SS type A sorting domain-containing protein [Flavihumibacter sp.]|nr:T9SS type A sorting domain-containing protein [Flavihumibacter sp.]